MSKRARTPTEKGEELKTALAEKEQSSKRRALAKDTRAKVDDLSSMFGNMKTSDSWPVAAHDTQMDGQGRRRMRKTRKRKGKKARKTRRHRK